ncbi:hypothetical protein PMAYCL1PPCAC_20476, partial [Pristionchus mayeri]
TFLYIQMELCQQSLAEWLDRNRSDAARSLPRIKSWFRQIVSALAYIHCENIIHRDLKPENILFSDEHTLKLCDLGISTVRRNDGGGTVDVRTSVGTAMYMSPEQATSLPIYSSKIDVFALGLILDELYEWKSVTVLSMIFDNYRTGKQSSHIRDATTAEFVKMLTQIEPKDRPSCDEMLCHSYLA